MWLPFRSQTGIAARRIGDAALGFAALTANLRDCQPTKKLRSAPTCHTSFLINSNHSLYVVQKLLGRAQIKTTARYSHLDPGTLLNAADAAANAAANAEGMGMVAVR